MSFSMIRIDILQAQAQLPLYVDRVARGETVILCKDNEPVAEIRRVAGKIDEPRPLGLAKGLVEMPPAFFDSLPDEMLRSFNGESPEER
jgi:antitoxin (DNA-binding transcriptional repressor) of toxin-antitoxin stability system